MSLLEKTSRKYISSDKFAGKLFGSILKHRWLVVLLIISAVMLFDRNVPELWHKVLLMTALTLLVATIISVCNTLTDLYSLLRKDDNVTTCQIFILAAIGIWIFAAAIILNFGNDTKNTFLISLTGSVLAIVFQDKIKGAVAYLHLRRHHLLNIGDWVIVPKMNADGVVKKITLTTVTLCNWDTTTSSIPVGALQTDHFINLQNMSQGKTYGRQMLKSFTLDTGCIRPITKEEADAFKSSEHGFLNYIPEDEIKAGTLNARLYRLYLYHWLMNNGHVSQWPRLIVRWLDHKDSGMALEVYSFITDSDTEAYEWQQSQIIEHILSSLEWFGLRLYQRPSAFDIRNSIINNTDKSAAQWEQEAL